MENVSSNSVPSMVQFSILPSVVNCASLILKDEFGPNLKEAAERAGRAEAGDDGAELLVGEDGADSGAIEARIDLGEIKGRQGLARDVEVDGFTDLGERGEDTGAGYREGELGRAALVVQRGRLRGH